MRKMLVLLSAVCLISLSACNNDKKSEPEVEPTVAPTEEVTKEGVTAEYNPELLFTVFDEETMSENFRSMDKVLPKVDIQPSEGLTLLPAGEQIDTLALSYTFGDKESTVGELLQSTGTNAYMVIRGEDIVDEQYFNGYTPTDKITSWSVAKSFLSVLIGIAVEEGKIKSIDDQVTDYVPLLADSAYEGVTIKQVLEMSSGVKFDEDYTNPESDVMQLMPFIVLEEGSVDDFTATLERKDEPSTFSYKSIDTQVIGMILKGATGMSASKYMEEKLWKPTGMSSSAYWNTDLKGNDMSFAFLNAELIDYARFGHLMLNDGKVGDKQIVPAEWIKESVTPSRDALKEGVADPYFGYGYQWWIPNGAEYGQEFVAMGVYGQYIYVNKDEDVVIVKFSSDPTIIMNDAEVVEAFRAIATQISK